MSLKDEFKSFLTATFLLLCFISSPALAKKSKKFKCPKKVKLKISSDLSKKHSLYGEEIELTFNKKFSLYSGHPKKTYLLKPHNVDTGEYGKKPMYWLAKHYDDLTLACSYKGKGHFEVSNLVLRKIEGSFKKCTSLSSKRGVYCK